MECCGQYQQTKEPVLKKTSSLETSQIKETVKYEIGTYDSAPLFLKDNEYIKRGYRNNFNSSKKILRSLFMVHNESVNVWSHLLGLIFVFVLCFYTAIYISNHNFFITEIKIKYREIKEDIGVYLDNIPSINKISMNINQSYEDSKSYLNEIASTVSKTTVDYIHVVDEKLNEYKEFINKNLNSIDSLGEEISPIISLQKIKESIVNESKKVLLMLEGIELKEFLDKINDKLLKFKDELFEKLESKELEWIDIYRNSKSVSDPKIKKWPLFVMLLGAVACLSGSTIFHLFSVHSEKYFQFLSRLDYGGISLLILGSCYPPYYYYLFCRDDLKNIYLTFMTVFSLFIFIVSLTEGFNTPPMRKVRGTLFLILGISAGVPIFHMMLLDGPGMVQNPNFNLWVIGGLSYIFGALIFIWRFPEKYWPGVFCIYGSSHQIFHCFVLVGVICHYLGSVNSYHERLKYPDCPK